MRRCSACLPFSRLSACLLLMTAAGSIRAEQPDGIDTIAREIPDGVVRAAEDIAESTIEIAAETYALEKLKRSSAARRIERYEEDRKTALKELEEEVKDTTEDDREDLAELREEQAEVFERMDGADEKRMQELQAKVDRLKLEIDHKDNWVIALTDLEYAISSSFGKHRRHKGLVGMYGQRFSAKGISLKGLDGQPFTLDDLIGKRPVLLNVWAPRNESSVELLSDLAAISTEYKPEKLTVVAIALSSDEAAVKRATSRLRGNVIVAMDTEQALEKKFNIQLCPLTAMIGPDGKIEGMYPGNMSGIDGLVEETMALFATRAGKDERR